MKVAFVSHAFPEYCIQHANELVSQGCEVLLVLPEEQTVPFAQTIDSRVEYFSFSYPRYRQPFRQWKAGCKILAAVKKFQPDVVHFQNGHLYFNFALRWLKNYPLVITVHDVVQHAGDKESGKTPQWVMDMGFRKADHTIIHGRTLADRLGQLGFDENQIAYIPHISIGKRDETKPHLDDGKTILFFGRIWGYKGIDYLIAAEPLITEKFPQVKIVIAGKGDDMEQYYSQMVHRDRFEVINCWVSDEQRTSLFDQASVVVLPYIEASQSGVVPIAYQHQKPVVATRIGGLPDAVDHGETGLLVEPRDHVELAEAVIQLLGDRDLRATMGRQGKMKLESEASPFAVVSQTIQVYQTAIERKKKNTTHSETKSDGPAEWDFVSVAKKLHQRTSNFVNQSHLLEGPDPGVRFNYRIWRFLKSLLPNRDWSDQVLFQQANGYWILANWAMSSLDPKHRKIALDCSDHVARLQQPNGEWVYPNNEWKGRVTTVEGVWASLGLLETFRQTQNETYLYAALRWNDYFKKEIGFQSLPEGLAVNYFANEVEEPVPNNSALAVRYFAELADATEDQNHLELCDGLIRFLVAAQKSTGEFPYQLNKKEHFQCFQYQAFIFLDLYGYVRLNRDSRILQMLQGLSSFLAGGLSAKGYAYYDCKRTSRTVHYHTAAVATALRIAGNLFSNSEFTELSDRAMGFLAKHQTSDGGFAHSIGDYGPIRDRRHYPRYLAMMLLHFCQSGQIQNCGQNKDLHPQNPNHPRQSLLAPVTSQSPSPSRS
ncbi:MAG: glycosyltransferase [Planctomycetota bacterium]